MADGYPGRPQSICGLWGYLTHLTIADPLRQRCSGPASTVTASRTGLSSRSAVPGGKKEGEDRRDRREGRASPGPKPLTARCPRPRTGRSFSGPIGTPGQAQTRPGDRSQQDTGMAQRPEGLARLSRQPERTDPSPPAPLTHRRI